MTETNDEKQYNIPSFRRFTEMPYVNLILKQLGDKLWRIFFVSFFSGLSNGAIVAIINIAATSHREGGEDLIRFFIMFVLAVIVYVYCNNNLLTASVQYGEQIVNDYRERFAERIRETELLVFDRLETTQVFVTLSDNTNIISTASLPIFKALGSSVMLIFCFSYLYFISPIAFYINIAMTFTTALIYMRVSVKVEESFSKAYTHEKSFFHYIQQLLDGIKEIKMSHVRGNDLHESYIKPQAKGAYKHKLAANRISVRNFLLTKTFVFCTTASFVFLLPSFQLISNEEMMSLITVVLFTISPIGDLVQAIPELARANVAVRKLGELESKLDVVEPEIKMAPVESVDTLRLVEAEFCYRDDNNEPVFCVGPANMEFRAGEVTFIVGGNGSGKSTIIKMLTGLYLLDSGAVLFDDVQISHEIRKIAREQFSVIFSGFHLFDRLYGMSDVNPWDVNKLLRQMKLESKTIFREGAFSRIDLSTGQRKRLALIITLLEDRPIYIFDEVAADQDPQFRAFFYNDILDELRKRGKIVIVASHDQEFFDVADKLYRFDYGRIIDVQENKRSKA